MGDAWPPAWQKAIDAAKACGDARDVAGALAVLEALPTGLEIHHACYGLGIAEIPDYREAKWVPYPSESLSHLPPILDYKIHRPANPGDRKCMLAWIRHWVPLAIERHLRRDGIVVEAAPEPSPPPANANRPMQLDLFAEASHG